MQHETISDRVDHARRQNCKIPVLSPPFCVPLTSMQQEIFVACEFRPDDNFNVCGRLDFEYETSLDLILEALIKVIQYNLNLNMRPVRKSDGIVFDRSGDGRLLAIDISALADPEAELSDWISRDVATVRGLDTDAVFELIAFKLKNKTFCVYYRFHHIIIDGYSGYLFSKQLVQYILQDPNSNYKDFKIIDYIKFINKSIDSEKKAKSDLEISFWKDYLSNYEKDSLLSHVKCSGLPSLEDKSTDYLSFLRNEFISEENIHFPTFFIACVAILISKISCKDAIYLSIPVTARERSTKELMSSFSNIIPIKVQLQPDSKFFEVYDTVKCEIRKVLRHSKTRGEFIYHNFFSSGGCTFGPLINILEFEFPNKMEEGHCKLQNLSSGPRPEVTFTAVRINDDAYDISITGPDDYKYGENINNIRNLFGKVLAWCKTNFTAPVDTLQLLTFPEKEIILKSWNSNFHKIEIAHLPKLFEDCVRRNPKQTAIIHNKEKFSFEYINNISNKVARYLLSIGVNTGTYVTVCLPPDVYFVAAMLGIWKAGAVYVPVDAGSSPDRIKYIVSSTNSIAIFIRKSISTVPEIEACLPIDFDDESIFSEIFKFSSHNVTDTERSHPLNISDPAYVIHTSGSTGAPKAVVVEHQNTPNHIAFQKARFDITEEKRILLVASIAFDSAMGQIFTSIFNGACLVLCDRLDLLDERKLIEIINYYHIDYIDTVPSLLTSISPKSIDRRCIINFGGEVLTSSIATMWASSHKIYNSYGPSETTIDAVVTDVLSPEECKIVPLGRPVWNARIYILDARGAPVPIGVAGELYVGGAGVARGYLNRPDLTAERFLPDPFSSVPGARMYRTGDLAHYQPDGTIIFLGRADDQIKIRGFRIEPGEIEARLAERPDVRSAVVIAREDIPGDKRLIGYVIPEPDAEHCDPAELRRALAASLPDYMVPAAIVLLDTLPLTPNGKLDRKALPAPNASSFSQKSFEPPRGPIEEKIAAIWSDLLGISPISRHDNFFELGGHSLLAARMITSLRERDMEISVGSVFGSQNLVDLSINVSLVNTKEDAISLENDRVNTTIPVDKILSVLREKNQTKFSVSTVSPLTPMQESLFYHHLRAKEHDPYVISTIMHFSKKDILDKYLNSIQLVINRHDSLRTAFLWEEVPHPLQVVLEYDDIKIIDLSEKEFHSAKEAIEFLRKYPHQIDLNSGFPIEFIITQSINEKSWFIRTNIHHLVIDQWSYDIIISECTDIICGNISNLHKPYKYSEYVENNRKKI